REERRFILAPAGFLCHPNTARRGCAKQAEALGRAENTGDRRLRPRGDRGHYVCPRDGARLGTESLVPAFSQILATTKCHPREISELNLVQPARPPAWVRLLWRHFIIGVQVPACAKQSGGSEAWSSWLPFWDGCGLGDPLWQRGFTRSVGRSRRRSRCAARTASPPGWR